VLTAGNHSEVSSEEIEKAVARHAKKHSTDKAANPAAKAGKANKAAKK